MHLIISNNEKRNYVYSSLEEEKEILFEATRTCVWLKLDVSSMCDPSGLINHQVKYFAKANDAFTIFLH